MTLTIPCSPLYVRLKCPDQLTRLLNADCPIERTVRLSLRTLEKDFDKSEDDIKALQSVGQIVGEVLKQLDEERCESFEIAVIRS